MKQNRTRNLFVSCIIKLFNLMLKPNNHMKQINALVID